MKNLSDNWIAFWKLPRSRENRLKWEQEETPNDELCGLARDKPNIAFEIVKEVVSKTDDEWLLELLASGPIEDLIYYHKDEYRNQLIQLAKRDPKYRLLNSYIWD